MGISNYQMSSVIALLPEVGLLLLAGVVLTMDVLLKDDRKHLMAVTTAVGSLLIILASLIYSQPSGDLIWGGMVRDDMLAFVFRLTFIFAGGITFIYI